MSELSIRNVHVNVSGKEILRGVDLTIGQGEVHALMGPNGTGKSTLAYSIMGHPNYEITEGEVWFKGINILDLEPDGVAKIVSDDGIQTALDVYNTHIPEAGQISAISFSTCLS